MSKVRCSLFLLLRLFIVFPALADADLTILLVA